MNKFVEVLKYVAWGILLFGAGMSTTVVVNVREKEEELRVHKCEIPTKTVIHFDHGLVANVTEAYGIPIRNSDPPRLIYPEAYWVTNYVHSKICSKCGGSSDWRPGQEFNGVKQPSCSAYLVYPPMQCDFPIIGTNIEQCVRWTQVLDVSEEQ